MRNVGKNTVKEWARLAAKLGLLLTEPKVRAAIGDQLKDRAEHVTHTVSSNYEDAVDRLAALQGRGYWTGKSHWATRATGFLLGIGVGAGLGILLAPAAGSDTRDAIRGKAVDMKNKVVESAHGASGRIRQSVANMPSTGTEG